MSSRYRIVIMECPYDSIESPLGMEMFGKLMALKIRGYKKEYSYGVLPVETSDFVSTHKMVCEEIDGKLFPLMAYKSISLDRAARHGMKLPLMELFETQENLKIPRLALEKVILEVKAAKKKLNYESSWTIDPEVRKDREKSRELRHWLNAIHVLDHYEKGMDESVLLGATKFKAEKMFESWGYSPICLAGRPIDPFEVESFDNAHVYLLHLKSFVKASRESAEQFRSEWNKRIVIDAEQNEKGQGVA